MSIFDTVAGFIGGQEAGDAQADAIRTALAGTNDLVRTTRADLAPQRNLGTQGANALNSVFFGTPAQSGFTSGAAPSLDFGQVNNALASFTPANQNEQARVNNALRRIQNTERLLNTNTEGFTGGQAEALRRPRSRRKSALGK